MGQSSSSNNSTNNSTPSGIGATLGTGSIDDLLYRFSRLISDKIFGSPSCQQIIVARQSAEVSCKGTDPAAIAAKTGPLCMSLIRAKSPEASKYCNACYLGDADQNIIMNFTATCLNNIVGGAINDVIAELDEFADIGNQQYIDAKNKLTQSTLVANITQYLLVNQNITVNDGNRVISGTSQTAIMDIVYRAVIESDVIGLLADMKNSLTYCRAADGTVYLCKKEPEVPKLADSNNSGVITKSDDGSLVTRVDIDAPPPIIEETEIDTSDQNSTAFYAVLVLIVLIVLVSIVYGLKKVIKSSKSVSQ
jgi:hypothetical protein